MQKSFKQLKLTFTFLSLLALLIISLVLFIAQIAFAKTTTTAIEPTPLETRTAISVEQQPATGTQTTVVADQTQATSTLEMRRARIATMLEARAEKRSVIETRRTEGSAVLAAAVQERVSMIADNAVLRLTETIDKLALIAVRLRVHALDLESRGVDVTAELSALASVEALFADARSVLAGIDVDIEYVVTSETPRAEWTEARVQFATIRDILTEAHTLLRETVTALKEAEMNS